MKLIILAGGKGTRLGNLTASTPKPMVLIGGKPVLEHQILWAKNQGIKEFILTLNHLPESIQNYFGNGESLGVDISYFIEPQPMGTAGALPLLADQLSETFAVLYGDVMLDIHLPKLLQFHQSKKAVATLVIHPNDHPYDSDLVDVDNNALIKTFYPKNRPQDTYYRNLVNAGFYLIEPALLQHIPSGQFSDFGKDLFPTLVNEQVIAGYNTPEYLKDMGTLDRLKKVERDLLSGKIKNSNLMYPRPAIFLDRDGCINEETGLIYTPEQLQLYPFAAEAIQKLNKSGFLIVVVTNQSVIARNLCSEDDLRQIHNKMESELGQGSALLNAIYYCPHHPHGGFPEENVAYKIDCDCRKPKSGMLFNAAKDLNIDLQKSWMIGDTERDIIAGRNAGTRTIGLRTGMALENAQTRPDFVMDNLLEAVEFILNPKHQQLTDDLLSTLKNTDSTYILGIAGNTRSGKSSLSKRLELDARSAGYPTLLITLDDWLAPKQERKNMQDVFERFQMPMLIEELQTILNGHPVQKKQYFHEPHLPDSKKTYQRLEEHKLIIIEGIVCLSAAQIREVLHQSIYLHSDPHQLEKRFLTLALEKGYTEEEGKKLFLHRMKDEYQAIALSATYASHRVNPEFNL